MLIHCSVLVRMRCCDSDKQVAQVSAVHSELTSQFSMGYQEGTGISFEQVTVSLEPDRGEIIQCSLNCTAARFHARSL